MVVLIKTQIRDKSNDYIFSGKLVSKP